MVNGDKAFETDLRANIETATFPIGLSSHLRSKFAIGIERDVLDDEETFLGHSVKGEGASTGFLITPHPR